MKDTRTLEDVYNGVPAPEIPGRMRDQHPAFRFFWGVVCALAFIGVYKFVTTVNWHSYFAGEVRVVTESDPNLFPVDKYEDLIQRWEIKNSDRPKRKKVTAGARAGEYEDEIPAQPGVQNHPQRQYDEALTPAERAKKRQKERQWREQKELRDKLLDSKPWTNNHYGPP